MIHPLDFFPTAPHHCLITFTNISNCHKTSGQCLYDISDHLPTFFIAKNVRVSESSKSMFKRSLKNFVLEHFLTDLQEQLLNIEVTNPNITANNYSTSLSSIFQVTLDKHAPLRQMSRREKRLSQKPWISKGILKSIKTKNKLFQTHYRSNDPDKKLVYKKYLNKLTHIKCLAKRFYYKNLFKENYRNSYQT